MADTSIVDVGAEVQRARAATRAEVDAAFAALLAWLTPSEDRRRLWDVEQGVWDRLWVLGRALLALWLAHRRPCAVSRMARGPDGRFYRWHGSRITHAKTMFGEVKLEREFYVIGGGKRGDTCAPLDHELGLQPTGFSLRTIGMAVFLCAKMSFGEARGTLQRFWGWAPATKSLHKMIDQVGPLARPFLAGLPAPSEDGEYLFVLADSKGAPMITDTEMSRRRRPHQKRPAGTSKWRRRPRKAVRRKRRKKGDKSKNAKMANVGVIYTLRIAGGVIEGPIHKRVYATFRCLEQLMIWLRAEADKRGYGSKRTIFIADGDRKIWRLQQRYFPKAQPCLDWFHAIEKLWTAGEILYAEGSDNLNAWVDYQIADFRAGRVSTVIKRLERLAATLPRSGPGTRGRRKRMKQVIGYLKQNLDRMPYAELRRDGLDIGSGTAEGAVRQLVGMRLDGPGMRWSPARAEYILQLRCIVINDLWDAFLDHFEKHGHAVGLRVIRPEGLGSTHNARLKKAA